MVAYFRCWTDAAEMKSLKVQDSICGIVAIFFIIRSFRFQFVPTLSNIDFQLLVFFFFFRRLETLFSMSNSMSLFQVFTKSRNSFRLSATNCISQRGHRSVGVPRAYPYYFWKLIYRLARWAGRKATLDTQIPWTSALRIAKCVCVCSFIELSVA